MNDYQNIIRQASGIIRIIAKKNFSQLKDKNITQKKDGSFVTDFDTAIDVALINGLSDLFPDIGFISEESQSNQTTIPGLVWCIDPIDGTHNFMMNIPYYAVSVGLLLDGDPIAGIIYDPISDNIICGGKGMITELNNKEITLKNDSFIVGTNRSHSLVDKKREQEYIQVLLENPLIKYRRFGSCALDLMNLVRGRIGAIYIIGNDIWDWSAGYAIAEASGLEIIHDGDIIRVNAQHLSEHLFMIK